MHAQGLGGGHDGAALALHLVPRRRLLQCLQARRHAPEGDGYGQFGADVHTDAHIGVQDDAFPGDELDIGDGEDAVAGNEHGAVVHAHVLCKGVVQERVVAAALLKTQLARAGQLRARADVLVQVAGSLVALHQLQLGLGDGYYSTIRYTPLLHTVS